jgi:hypothetical protein
MLVCIIHIWSKVGDLGPSITGCCTTQHARWSTHAGLLSSPSTHLCCQPHPQGEFEKAAQLYQKAGRLRRAVEMCFECRLYDVLQQIADSLAPGSDPGLVARCADFFAENGQHDKAAAMLVAAKRWQQALDTILAHNVQITEVRGGGQSRGMSACGL